ncbi:septum formation protein [Peptoniphilus asaccharolyticus DSM 20463]|uniref:dTTP/UTP pyrophosphatase n=1 Tax=Peptoniphilus asaccharolyticus DSM 20463 TaxID=573058 RepID=A0A1W1UML3_PEPAS|nr:Maf family protein [Peptoniphilus asaccharolyticus]MBL7574926.1 septum formation protein Maf [Peptoniphilus asaccharolyticus]SMB82336.1 septum formation protein [Peptoniphilus asaccharolyticus DSM 20463]
MNRKIILASNSPRRREMLSEFIDFDIVSKSVKEIYDYNVSEDVNVMSIAFNKAYEVAKENEEAIVIAADTLVYKDGPLGKPKDREDAKNMLLSLSGTTHDVLTGCAVMCLEEKYKKIFYERTEVKFKNLTELEIEEYLDTLEYKDKAGAYGIQGYGSLLVDSISGDFFNVVGLPISKLSDVLNKDLDIDFLKR